MKQSGILYMLVIFTGKETKQVLNSGEYINKMSTIDKTINWILFINIMLMIILLGIPLAVSCGKFIDSHENHTYLGLWTESKTSWAMKAFGSFYLLNNSAVPLDLVV